jgi:hypothetical protein
MNELNSLPNLVPQPACLVPLPACVCLPGCLLRGLSSPDVRFKQLVHIARLLGKKEGRKPDFTRA